MTDSPPKDQQQFEQVLTRLDALIKRSHHEAAPLPQLAEEAEPLELILPAEETPPAPHASSSHTPFVVVESTPIPILTEIYEGKAVESQPPAPPPAASAVLAPAILDALDRAIHEELAQFQQSLAIRLRREITAALQQPEETAAEKPTSPDSPIAGD